MSEGLTVRELQQRVHKAACEKGWWTGERNVGELIALMHSELSEAMEEWREHGVSGRRAWEAGVEPKPVGLGIELADCVIRIADFCERWGLDLTASLEMKMAYNDTREFRHGGKRA
jgi:hypothetical protein